MLCHAGCSSSSLSFCNGRYSLLTCSSHAITELCGGNPCLLYVSPLPPVLRSLSIYSICQRATVSLLSSAHTHTHTLTRLTQQLILILNLFREKENEFRRRGVSLHGCLYQYLYIDLALPLLLHSSRYRLVFPAGISAYNLTDGWSA